MVDEHLAGYQARDFQVVDYQLFQLPGCDLHFRGPAPETLSERDYVACIGAAQTFGCLCTEPYPLLLAEQLGVTALNLGYGGAGPRFFNRHAELLPLINRSRFAVVQVMSGRSEDNHLFESKGLEFLTRRRDGKRMSADAAWRSVLESRYAWKKLPIGQAPARWACRAIGSMRARTLAAESRHNWCRSYRQLLGNIRVPTILLWFSRRRPSYHIRYENLQSMFQEFPQLVNQAMIDEIRGLADVFVECVTRRGSPQPLYSRFDGSPVTIDLGKDRPDFAGQLWHENPYYPSPEMHADAARMLAAAVHQQGLLTC